jgi:hypothetical protein
MSKEDNIREVLHEAMEAIIDADDDSCTWLSWMVYPLLRLEEKVTGRVPLPIGRGMSRCPRRCRLISATAALRVAGTKNPSQNLLFAYV